MSEGISFSGMIFLGYQYFPAGVFGDINTMRKWALKEGAITEPELHLITQDKISDPGKTFTKDDKFFIMTHLHKDNDGKLIYFEYPYVPVKTR